MEKQICPLCDFPSGIYHTSGHRFYYRCRQCDGISLNQQALPLPDAERIRYAQHENNVEDPGYQQFSLPLAAAIMQDFHPEALGLDFGSGPNSALAYLLREKGYRLRSYDPFFAPDSQVLTASYDYVVCCEVVEHFHFPKKEFNQLFRLLKPGGKLYIMTNVYHDEIDFGPWYYKNDFTHVFFYTVKTWAFIAKQFGFSHYSQNKRVVVFKR